MSNIILPGHGFGHAVHGLDDRLIGARMLGWMLSEANGTNWWICGLLKDGKIVAWDSTAKATDDKQNLKIPKERELFAINVMSALVEVAEGGTWLCAWFDDCKRFYLLWKDEDGDIQIPIECDQSWLRLSTWKPDDFCRHAAHAHATWLNLHKNMEYGAGQQIKLAKGEKPSSTIH